MSIDNRRILLIDDLLSIHEDFRKILTPATRSDLDALEALLFGSVVPVPDEFTLDCALQGQEGIDMADRALAEGRPYALAFVDMRMPPGLDGAQTIARLWHSDPQLQVVLCTAYSAYRWDELLAQLDIRDRMLILKKPFDAIEVMQLAAMLTAKWAITRHAESELRRLDEAVRARTAALQEEMEERKRLESRLVQSEALASVGRLAAGVAHQMNNPLAFLSANFQSLEGYLQALIPLMDCPPSDTEQTRRSLSDMRQDLPDLLRDSRAGLVRMKEIVQRLRDFSHPERGQQWAWADVRVCIETTLAMLRADEHDAVEIVRHYGAVPDIRCLPAQLNQLIMSLCINSIEAIGGSPGTLTIRTGTHEDYVWIEVIDTGCGIAPHDLPLVFDPFFTTKGVGKNVGLGLSQGYGIVQAHQGSIAAHTRESGGTVVRVQLPVDGAKAS